MKKVLITLFLCLPMVAFATDTPSTPPTPPVPPAPTPRVSVFSTTTDWSALTGLPLRQFVGKFSWNNKDVSRGLEMYYLDAFPCYGEADSVRVWLGPNKQSEGTLRLVCVHAPKAISFTWRNATRDADQGISTGILNCPVTGENNLSIDISKCTRGLEWKEYK